MPECCLFCLEQTRSMHTKTEYLNKVNFFSYLAVLGLSSHLRKNAHKKARASLVGQEASPNARNLNKETPTQNAGVSLLSLRFLLKLAISLTSNNSKRYVTNIYAKDSYYFKLSAKISPEMPSTHLNKPTGQRGKVFPEDENHNCQKQPEAAHFGLLPPCQLSFNFDYLGIHSVSVNDAVSINNLRLDLYGMISGFILQRVGERPVGVNSRFRGGVGGLQTANRVAHGLSDILGRHLDQHRIGHLYYALAHLHPHAVERRGGDVAARTASRYHGKNEDEQPQERVIYYET